MGVFLECVAFNSILAAALAVAAMASRSLRRPALTHALWLIVLARLVTPPVWTIALPNWPAAAETSATRPAQHEDMPTPTLDDPPVPEIGTILEFNDEIFPPVGGSVDPRIPQFSLIDAAAAAWLFASIGLLVLTARRIGRLRSALRVAVPVDLANRRLVAGLSRRMGLRRVPDVWVVPARVPPCVHAFWSRPTILVPAGWLESLPPRSRAAVLVHELAHIRRGDHWVRRFELAVTAVLWWHPLVWLARRELRAAEELCCDQWVLATLPAARRAYADALVDTADFLSPAPALPPLACGLGHVRELKRRLHMILQSQPARRPGRAGALLALAFGALALPVGLARSGDEGRTDGALISPIGDEDDAPASDTPRRQAERESQLLRERAAQEVERAREQATRAERRARDEMEMAAQVAEKSRRSIEGGGREMAVDRLRDELAQARRQAEEARRRIERLEQTIERLTGEQPEVPRTVRPARIVEVAPGTPRPPRPASAPIAPLPPLAPAPPDAAAPVAGMLQERVRAAPQPGAGRLEALERQMELLRRELTELRRELQRRPPPGTPAEE